MTPQAPSSSVAVDLLDPPSRCPACAHQLAVPLLDSDEQPFATLAWPQDADEAKALERFRLDFMRCLSCGHVFNRSFEYDNVPYSKKPNRMFNSGREWQSHLRVVRDLMLERLGMRPVVIEIGSGQGEFLEGLQRHRPGGTFVGFDPYCGPGTPKAITVRGELFVPDAHLTEYRPDLIISRHVLEHLDHPLGLIENIALVAYREGLSVSVFVEVPCIDRALETGRTVDFYYEHKSHFTSESFRTMLERAGAQIELISKGYNDEVIYALARLGVNERFRAILEESARFREGARAASDRIRGQLSEIHAAARKVAIWGGTGKASAFMNRYQLDAKRFPVVVDSDPEKIGTFVPGQGQRIVGKEELLAAPVEVLIVPMQWRVRDIVEEMSAAGIEVEEILLEHEGRLVDYCKDANPY